MLKPVPGAEVRYRSSESRELNRKLSTNKMDENLHQLYTPDDTVSEAFPKTLGELCALDSKQFIPPRVANTETDECA